MYVILPPLHPADFKDVINYYLKKNLLKLNEGGD